MAIIFVSPRKKQKIVFWGMAAALMLAMAGISIAVFLPEITTRLVGNKAVLPANVEEVKINFKVVDSTELKNLEFFEPLATEETQIGRENPFSAFAEPAAPKK
ncbi:MAG TPA: hypothetical protein VI937_00710 [Negativicutes bacterium]|nr:hypothetical protein [Negativicutes bacterium]